MFRLPATRRRQANRAAKNRRLRHTKLSAETLERREMNATDVTAHLVHGTLFVYGDQKDDNLQVRFTDQRVEIWDQVAGERVPIHLSGYFSPDTTPSITRQMLPYYVLVSTGEGKNRVSVQEDLANPAKPLTVYGGQSDDVLIGGTNDDALIGLGGVDQLFGNDGNDFLLAGYGLDDELAPERGEQLDGGAGDDHILGGKGNDTILPGLGVNTIDGRQGMDLIVDSLLAVDNVANDGLDLRASSFAKYLEAAPQHIRSGLGAPTSGIQFTIGETGLVQRFANGVVTFSPHTGVHAVYGAVYAKWQALGGIATQGYPTSDPQEFGEGIKVFDNGNAGQANVAPANFNVALPTVRGLQRGVLAPAPTRERVLELRAKAENWSLTTIYQSTQAFEKSTLVTAPFGKTIFIAGKDQPHVLAVSGVARDKYRALGGALGELGAPVAEATATPVGNGQVVHFERGSIYIHGGQAYRVGLEIDARYAATAKEKDAGKRVVQAVLGLPIADESPAINGGRVVKYQGGAIFYSAATGAQPLFGAIGAKYAELANQRDQWGRPMNEVLGLPLSTERLSGLGGRNGRYVQFQGGNIYWSNRTAAQEVHGAILAKYLAEGGANGRLGLPISDESAALGYAPEGRASRFENGSLLWRPGDVARVGFDRTEMINLLRNTAQDGNVTVDELIYLKQIIADPANVIPEHVRNLAGKVINGDRANRSQLDGYGVLQAGRTGAALNRLTSKWFLGAYRPAAPGFEYDLAVEPLFNPATGKPSADDVQQGGIGDCYFLAALEGLARQHPDVIKSMFIDNGDGTLTVRFFNNGRPEYVTVDRMLPVNRVTRALPFAQARNGALWVALAEKAYCQVNESCWIDQDGRNRYFIPGANNENLGISSGFGWRALAHITGWPADYDSKPFWPGSTSDWYNTMVQQIFDGRTVVVGSKSSGDLVHDKIVPSHAYSVYSISTDGKRITLSNPWRTQVGGDRPTPDLTGDLGNGLIELSRDEFIDYFVQFSFV